jgi:maltoporin
MKVRAAAMAIVSAVLALTAAGSASALEYKPYFRGGVGFNSRGGGQTCFALPYADFKARLGNECDQYAELEFSEVIYKDDTGLEFKYVFMPAFGVVTTAPGLTQSGYGSGDLYVQQNWASVTLPQLGGASIWAGLRYFRRHDIHSYDWFYWNPNQGNAGAGIENINLGFGQLALTLTRIDGGSNAALGAYIMPEARVYGMPTNPNGALEVGLDVAIAHDQRVTSMTDPAVRARALGDDRLAVSPWFTVEHVQKELLGGANKLAFQFGLGAMGDMNGRAIVGASSHVQQWRILDQFYAQPIPELSGALVLVYQNKSADADAGASILTAEARPAFHITDYFKIALDVSYQSVWLKNSDANVANLLKVTLAPTLVPMRGYFARPEIRLFATYAHWNDSATRLALAKNQPMASGAYGQDTNGFTFGVHMEGWMSD